MGSIRRLAAIAGAVAVAGAFVAGPAAADTPEVYAGSAAAKALDLNILGQQATLGVSTAKVSSDLKAAASGAGQLVPQLTSFAGNTDASVTGSGSSTKPNTCATPALPDPIPPVLSNNPVATSTASVAQVAANAQTILQQLNAVTTPIGSTLDGLLTQVCTNLSQTCSATTTVQDLVNSVLNTQTLGVEVGPSASSVTTEASKVTSTASAAGAVVKLLPLPVVSGVASSDPVATITVGEAKASAVYDRSTGTSTPTVTPALVHVHFNTALTTGTPLQDIAVTPGQDITILAGTPLESRIVVASGSTPKNADGSVGAVADGVRLELLKGLNGGVTLGLAHAEAGVGGAIATKTPALIPDVARELPRTGGTPWIPMAGIGVLGLAVVLRRTTAKAAGR
jgi:hypothetical protein